MLLYMLDSTNKGQKGQAAHMKIGLGGYGATYLCFNDMYIQYIHSIRK